MTQKKYGFPRWAEEEYRPDSLVKVEFKVQDIPGTITDSGSPEMYDAIMELLGTFQAYDIKFDSEPIWEGGSKVEPKKYSERWMKDKMYEAVAAGHWDEVIALAKKMKEREARTKRR